MALFVRRRWPKVVAAVAVVGALAFGGWWLLVRDPAPKPPAPLTEGDVETADPVPEPSPDTVAFDAVLSGDLGRYEGHQTSATSVRVLSVVGPSAAWVGPSSTQRVLLVIVATEPFSFQAGATVSFTGTVQRTTPAFGRALGLSAAEAARLDGYVEVSAVATG